MDAQNGNGRKLTFKQNEFCKWYVLLKNATEAAKRAGYSEKTAFQIGAENLKKPKIQYEIEIRKLPLQERFALEVEASIRTLVEIRDNPEVNSSSRITAAADLMDRAGTKAVEKQEVEQRNIIDVTGELAKLHIAYAAALADHDKLSGDHRGDV